MLSSCAPCLRAMSSQISSVEKGFGHQAHLESSSPAAWLNATIAVWAGRQEGDDSRQMTQNARDEVLPHFLETMLCCWAARHEIYAVLQLMQKAQSSHWHSFCVHARMSAFQQGPLFLHVRWVCIQYQHAHCTYHQHIPRKAAEERVLALYTLKCMCAPDALPPSNGIGRNVAGCPCRAAVSTTASRCMTLMLSMAASLCKAIWAGSAFQTQFDSACTERVQSVR